MNVHDRHQKMLCPHLRRSDHAIGEFRQKPIVPTSSRPIEVFTVCISSRRDSCSARYLMPFQLISVVLLLLVVHSAAEVLVVYCAAEVLVDATCDTRAGLEPAEAALGPDKIYAANSALVSAD